MTSEPEQAFGNFGASAGPSPVQVRKRRARPGPESNGDRVALKSGGGPKRGSRDQTLRSAAVR
eukprot:11623154-Alexandrium_andersonii.AAC.1